MLLGISVQLVKCALVVLAVQFAIAAAVVAVGYRSKVPLPRLTMPEPAGEAGRGSGY